MILKEIMPHIKRATHPPEKGEIPSNPKQVFITIGENLIATYLFPNGCYGYVSVAGLGLKDGTYK